MPLGKAFIILEYFQTFLLNKGQIPSSSTGIKPCYQWTAPFILVNFDIKWHGDSSVHKVWSHLNFGHLFSFAAILQGTDVLKTIGTIDSRHCDKSLIIARDYPHLCALGWQSQVYKGAWEEAERFAVEPGDARSDKRQIKDVCVLCHQAPRQRMILVIKYFILRTLQRDFQKCQ